MVTGFGSYTPKSQSSHSVHVETTAPRTSTATSALYLPSLDDDHHHPSHGFPGWWPRSSLQRWQIFVKTLWERSRMSSLPIQSITSRRRSDLQPDQQWLIFAYIATMNVGCGSTRRTGKRHVSFCQLCTPSSPPSTTCLTFEFHSVLM
jgi:hypothetical protein